LLTKHLNDVGRAREEAARRISRTRYAIMRKLSLLDITLVAPREVHLFHHKRHICIS